MRHSSYTDEFMDALRDPSEAEAYVTAAVLDSRESYLRAVRDVQIALVRGLPWRWNVNAVIAA